MHRLHRLHRTAVVDGQPDGHFVPESHGEYHGHLKLFPESRGDSSLESHGFVPESCPSAYCDFATSPASTSLQEHIDCCSIANPINGKTKRLKNRKIARRDGQTFRNTLTACEYWVPESEDPQKYLAKATNMPQAFVWLHGTSFVISVSEHDYFKDAPDWSCSICGDSGQQLLDGEFQDDAEKSRQR